LLSPNKSLENLIVRDQTGLHGQPHAQYREFRLNNLGMRGPDVSLEKPLGTLRVLTVGASETFGLYESAGTEYPRQLEDSLNSLLHTVGCRSRDGLPWRVEVLNAAFAGMTLPTITNNMRLQYRDLSPDVVVVYPTPVGYLDDKPPSVARGSAAQSPPTRLNGSLYPRAASQLRNQLKALLPSAVQTLLRRGEIAREVKQHGPSWRFRAVPEERLQLYDEDLRSLVEAIDSIGASPILATHANRFAGRAVRPSEMLYAWERFYPRAAGELLVTFDSLARLRTIAAAEKTGAGLVDVGSALESGVADSLFADFSHFRRAGSAIVAGMLSRRIAHTLQLRGRC
jgi:hypothetical protein